MEFQFHPASGRAAVRTLKLAVPGERALLAFAAAGSLLAVSLWWTVPEVVLRSARQEDGERAGRETAERRNEHARVQRLAQTLLYRVTERGNLLNRIAFLYGVPSTTWPRALNPEREVLAGEDAEGIVLGLVPYLRALERGCAILLERERSDPELPRRVPAILPFAEGVFEPSAFFGPRVSPWTGEEEFFPGVDIAAPGGSPVVAAGAGTVVFAGTVRRFSSSASWFWRHGNLVVVSHGPSGATVYGHLSRIEARAGQKVLRGQRIGEVGQTGWAISPQLHYEYWRPEGDVLRPTDPFFTVLDGRLAAKPVSLEQMQATSTPGPLDPLPGLGRPANP